MRNLESRMAYQRQQGSNYPSAKQRSTLHAQRVAPPPARSSQRNGSTHRRPAAHSYSTYPPPRQRNRRLIRNFFFLIVVLGFLTGAILAWSLASPKGSQSFALFKLGQPQVQIQRERIEAKAEDIAQLKAALTPPEELPPFELHPLARLSYVPSIMYHDVVGTRKQVWFDTTAAELRQHFEQIREAGVTPISADQLYRHLRDGEPLPEKAILLTFDDGYLGQYDNAYPLLQEFNYPATYYVQTGFVGVPTSKDHFTWEQMQQMDREGLVSFAAHTITHPADLRDLEDDQLQRELVESKLLMEEKLGHPIVHFAYPSGYRDDRVKQAVADAGYAMALTMDSGYTGQSPNLLEVRRFNQFHLTEALVGAQTVITSSLPTYDLEVTQPLEVENQTLDRVETITIRGGRVATVHADRRYDVGTLMERYHSSAGINGGFFSIPWINSASNVMVGPVMAANTNTFIQGRPEDTQAVRGRPLVLIGQDRISFVPFDPESMNHLEAIQQLMPDVKDLFVAGVWLVKEGKALTPEEIASFRLASADGEYRPRAFIGVDENDHFVAGATVDHVTASILAKRLPDAGIKEAVLLDSGFSTSLIYQDEILATGHASAEQPSRPVPHAIMIYDMPELWARADEIMAEAEEPSGFDRLIDFVPASEQLRARTELQSVLQGQTVLERGDRGIGVMALQLGLGQLAASKARSDLLPSGADGVFGGEVVYALAELGLTESSETLSSASPDQLNQPSSPASATQAPWGSQLFNSNGGSPQPTPLVYGSVDGADTNTSSNEPAVEVVDAAILRSLMTALEDTPDPILVSQTVARKPVDLSRKPTGKLGLDQGLTSRL